MVIFQIFNLKKRNIHTLLIPFFLLSTNIYIYIYIVVKKCHNDYGSRKSNDNGKICYYDKK